MLHGPNTPVPWEGLTYEERLARTTYCAYVTNAEDPQSKMALSKNDGFKNTTRLTELDEFLSSVGHTEVQQHMPPNYLGIKLEEVPTSVPETEFTD